MGFWGRALLFGAAFAAVLAGLAGPAVSAPLRLPDSLAPSPALMGLSGLEHRNLIGGLFAYTELGDRYFVKEQMVGILVSLEAARLRPDLAAYWTGVATNAWRQSQSAYDAASGIYAATVPPPDTTVCVSLDTHAWVLRAALALSRIPEGGSLGAAQKAAEVRDVLTTLVQSDTFRSKPACNVPPQGVNAFHWALPLMALVESRDAFPSPSTDRAVQEMLARLRRDAFAAGYRDPSGLYGAVPNAQMLLVLLDARQAYQDPALEADLAATRDLLRNRALVERDGETIAVDLQRTGDTFAAASKGSEMAQVWTAWALSNYDVRRNVAGAGASPISALLKTYAARYWSPRLDAFASDDGHAHVEPNALPVLFFGSPALTVMPSDPPVVSLLVPAEELHSYAEASGAPGLIGSNQWTHRFQLAANHSGTLDVVLPVRLLAPLNLSVSSPGFAPTPHLFRGPGGGEDVPFTVSGGGGLAAFTPILGPTPTPFRLVAFAPVVPLRSEVAGTIRVTVENAATDALTLATLQLDIAVTNIQISRATVDQQGVTDFLQNPAARAEALSDPHLQVLLHNVLLPASSVSVIGLEYTDQEPPSVEDVAVSRDPSGREGSGRDAGPVTVVIGATTYVRATVRDNVGLRRVTATYQSNGQSETIDLQPVGGNVFLAELPKAQRPGEGSLRVNAFDWVNGYDASDPVVLTFQYGFLSGGSIVLFAFSALLFATSVVIYVKVRRRSRRT